MLKLKSLTLLFVLSLLMGCNTPFTTVKDEPKDPEPVVQVTKEESAWQQAYGESQDHKQNTLPDVASPEIDLEKLTQPAPITDLWQRIRNGYGILPPTLHRDSQQQLTWFVKHPEYMSRVVERARPYLYHIVEQLEQRNMPLEIALLPVVESGFQPFAYSHGRAAGLWQFIPGTGKMYGLKQNWWYDGRRDVIQSTRAALDYLEKLHRDFGDWQLALAAYNCGEGTVGRAIKKNKKAGKKTDFWSLDLPKETSAYVPKLMAVAHLIQNPEKYELALSPIDNVPFLTVIDVGTQMDLALAAKLAEISTEEMYQLNPGFNQWATTPDGPHHLVIPVEKADVFQQGLASLPTDKRVQWTRHKIKTGESLGVIAQHYKTTTAVLKEANGLGSNTIRAGRHLLIPIASGKPSDYPLTVSQRLVTRQNTPRRGDKKIHTVRAGDTWWDIANHYKVGVRQLTKWNNKAPADTLHLGQKLVVFTKGKSTSSNKRVRTINYKIRSGDSLWKISKKFNVSVAQVREWNGLSDRTLLKPGQNLTLHIDVTRQHSSI
ncbi:MAG: LysM peptidoglycan-binding domain-containing protein [Piscirickettsiaceae bacterium]|nr:LysM peptidoglycan-binding domain-containing protein [Piscirickettsiaceae bacterium]